MQINEIQNRIVAFARKRLAAQSISDSPELSFIHLTEEIGEIARQLANQKLRPRLFDEENLKEEIVDVILEALILASLYDFDLDAAITKKIDALYKKHGFSEPTFSKKK